MGIAPTANLLEVIARVRNVFPGIKAQLPQGLQGEIVYDSTKFVNSSINEVVKTLVEALLMPNAKIKEGYASVVVETKDGEEYTGTLARETPEEIFLRNASGQEVAVVKSTVLKREIGRLSLPAGETTPSADDREMAMAESSLNGKQLLEAARSLRQ